MKPATAGGCAAALCVGIVLVTSLNARADETAASRIDRFLNSGHPFLTSYRARRVLTASTMSGTMHASLEAWTTLDPDGTFSFEVIRQEGSGLTRKRVLFAALETEQRTRNSGEMPQSELTRENYEFQIEDRAREDGLAIVRLFPRRKTPMLAIGVAILRPQDGDLVRIDGRPAKSPSWFERLNKEIKRRPSVVGIFPTPQSVIRSV